MFWAMSVFSCFDKSPRRFQVTNIRRIKVTVQRFPLKQGSVSWHIFARYAFREFARRELKCLL